MQSLQLGVGGAQQSTSEITRGAQLNPAQDSRGIRPLRIEMMV
jgi:hypothetical protein